MSGTGTGSEVTIVTGPYCEHADILGQISPDVLIQLTDDACHGVADMSRVTQAIAAADAEIDGYCAGRYTVPFAPVPAVIKPSWPNRPEVPTSRNSMRFTPVESALRISLF